MLKKGVNPIPEDEQWKLFVLLLKELAIKKYGKSYANKLAEETGFHYNNIYRMFDCKYKITLANFLKLAKPLGINFFFQSRDEETNLNLAFEKAMEELGRRIDKLPKN